MSKPLTHRELTIKACYWLRANGYRLCVAEPVTDCAEIPDAIGWKNKKWSALIECKTSRSDFRKDAEKPSRRDTSKQLGQIRYYLAPEGIIPLEELPKGWGLLELVGRSIKVKVAPPKTSFNPVIASNELPLVLHLLRRAEIKGVNLSETWVEYHKNRVKKIKKNIKRYEGEFEDDDY